MSPILSRRYCLRGHELIAGTTAYVVTRWTGREVFLPQSGGLLEACAGGPVNGTPCRPSGQAGNWWRGRYQLRREPPAMSDPAVHYHQLPARRRLVGA